MLATRPYKTSNEEDDAKGVVSEVESAKSKSKKATKSAELKSAKSTTK
jgi:hypothetical protein